MSDTVRARIVDHGTGNLVSIAQALAVVRTDVSLVKRPSDVEVVDLLVVPGVKTAAPAMTTLHREGLVDPIRG